MPAKRLVLSIMFKIYGQYCKPRTVVTIAMHKMFQMRRDGQLGLGQAP